MFRVWEGVCTKCKNEKTVLERNQSDNYCQHWSTWKPQVKRAEDGIWGWSTYAGFHVDRDFVIWKCVRPTLLHSPWLVLSLLLQRPDSLLCDRQPGRVDHLVLPVTVGELQDAVPLPLRLTHKVSRVVVPHLCRDSWEKSTERVPLAFTISGCITYCTMSKRLTTVSPNSCFQVIP